jgi:ssDNA-binding Zn-finger/Zn-ribbon topoisomerase 1
MEGIKDCLKCLGKQRKVIDNFFDGCSSYNSEQLEKAGISKENLKDYADLKLGIKIYKCIKAKGSCSFDAEL